MSKNYFLLLLLIPFFTKAQQETIIKNVDTDGGKIEVTQTGKDSAQNSLIDSIKGDSIKIKVIQSNSDNTRTPEKKGGFSGWISNTNNLLGAIVSLALIIGFFGKLIFAKKKSSKRK
jgi:hypothetical protein